MAKIYSCSHIVLIRNDEDARSRNWATDQEDFLVRSLGRGRWSVRPIPAGLGTPRCVHTSELERRYLRRPDTEVHVYKART